VLVLDKSGSMNQPVAGARASQQQIANEGAALAIESLRSDSLVGVITFDMFTSVIVPLQPNTDPKKLAAEVRAITADGGTNMPPALARAYDMLKDAKAEKKRIVCMTDGRSQSDNYDEVVRKLKAANIQLTTIAVGDDTDDDTLQKLAAETGGEFKPVRDPRELPRTLIDSVQVINKPLLKDIPFEPKVLATGSTLTAGMSAAPMLNGLVITSPRKDPKVTLEMISPDGEPLLAHWQAGLGRAAAFTSSEPRAKSWAEPWLDWPTASTFWIQLARMVARPAMNTDAELIATVDGDRLNVSYEITGDATRAAEEPATSPDATHDHAPAHIDPRLLDYLTVAGSVYGPDGTSMPIRLRQTAPGRYEAAVNAPLAGNYIVALNPRQGARQLAPAIGGASKSTSPEFRRYRSNIGLLDEIAETTGGRRLDIANPQAVNLFDRRGMPRSESSLPVWPIVLWWTLAVLLLDVACRRIAWDMPAVQRLAVAAMTKVTPARLRGRKAVSTLETLRRVSADLEQQHDASTAGIAKLKGTGRIMPPPERIIQADGTSTLPEGVPAEARPRTDEIARVPLRQPAAPAAPESGKVTAALDALLGRREVADAPALSAAPRGERPDAAPSGTPPPPPPSETTSSLLAAKRRARQRLAGGDGETSNGKQG
jgi:uncharacterized protein YegL